MAENTSLEAVCTRAAELLSKADGLLITAGAGIGIDSGLPDFRGDHGFWKAYPALGKLGMSFTEIANPAAFRKRPEVAWGFYGHRLALYRQTVPHAGFSMLLDVAAKMPHGAGVFTSNVDGQFQKAGFDPGRVTECHGSIRYLQCLADCGQAVWPATDFKPVVDAENCVLVSDFPTCPTCGSLARPNILMFGDWGWDGSHAQLQEARLEVWLMRTRSPVVIELGAGTAIPTARRFGERAGCPLIRINPTESQVGLQRDIGIATGALHGVSLIASALVKL